MSLKITKRSIRELLGITLLFFIYFFYISFIIWTMRFVRQKIILFLFISMAGVGYAQPGPSNPSPVPPTPSHEHPEPPRLPPKDESKIFNYRGNRTYIDNLPLKINQVKCFRFDERTVSIEIIFNQNINPRSFRKEAFYIDNNPLPDFCRFSFNRRGDTIKFVAPVNSQTFKLKIQKVRSFSGNIIEPVEMLVEVKAGE